MERDSWKDNPLSSVAPMTNQTLRELFLLGTLEGEDVPEIRIPDECSSALRRSWDELSDVYDEHITECLTHLSNRVSALTATTESTDEEMILPPLDSKRVASYQAQLLRASYGHRSIEGDWTEEHQRLVPLLAGMEFPTEEVRLGSRIVAQEQLQEIKSFLQENFNQMHSAYHGTLPELDRDLHYGSYPTSESLCDRTREAILLGLRSYYLQGVLVDQVVSQLESYLDSVLPHTKEE